MMTTPNLQLQMVSRACPVCGSLDESHVFAAADFDATRLDGFAFASRKVPEYMHYRLISCPVCDLLYATPIPALETLAAAYEEAEFDSNDEAAYAGRTYAGFLSDLKSTLPDTDGALDIGTGDGVFLEQLLSHGFTDVVGVEPSTAPIAAAKESIRPLIRHALFAPEDFQAGQFSLITCFQTWEHLYDPLQLCQDAYFLLKPGGIVFFIGHNRRSFLARLMGMKSPIFDIEHLQLFSPKSGRYLLQKVGFQDLQVKAVINRYPLRYFIKLSPIPLFLKSKILRRLEKSRLGSFPISVPLGNLAVIGRKPMRPVRAK